VLKYFASSTAEGATLTLATQTTKFENLSLFTSGFANIASYKEFIDSIISSGYIQIGSYTYKLTHIIGGRYGIDLSKKKDGTSYSSGYIKNELVAEFAIMIGGVKAHTISAYNNITGFRLTTSNKLTATGSNSYTINKMFMLDEIYPEDGYSKTDISNIRVLGIVKKDGVPDKAWVSQNNTPLTSAEIGDLTKIATIKVKNGKSTGTDADYNIYTLNTVMYTSTTISGSTLYSLSETFYVIETSSTTSSEIFTKDYLASGFDTNRFAVYYDESKTEQELDCSVGVFKTYKMDGNVLSFTITEPTKFECVTSGLGAKTDAIKIESKYLIEYYRKNPTTIRYESIRYIVTNSSDVSLLVEVAFLLPTSLETEAISFTGTAVEPASIMFGTGSNQYTFGGYSLSQVKEITFNEYEDCFESFNPDTGAITLKADKLSLVLPSAGELKISCNVEMVDGVSYDFYIVVVRS